MLPLGQAQLLTMRDLGFILMTVSLGVYFLPTLCGMKKRNAGAIFALNLLLGWTLIGWVVALVWALTVEPVTPAFWRVERATPLFAPPINSARPVPLPSIGLR